MLLLALASAPACRAAPEEAGYFGTAQRASRDWTTLYVNNYDEPEFLDPGLGADGASATLLYELFEGLVVRHPEDLHPVPGVAIRWERSDDNRIYRFQLRPEARWSDGKPVTAHDFVYAWRRVLTPKTGSRMAALLYPIKNGKPFHQGKIADPAALGVRALGDLGLEVELERPTPYFLDLVGYQAFFPVRQDVVERFAAQGRPDLWFREGNIVSNGPYELESWKFRYEIAMRRNPYHYDRDKLKIHRIVWMALPEHNATLSLYKTAEIDLVAENVALPAEQMERLGAMKDYWRSVYLATYWYDLNVTKPPLTDVRVRRALDLAIDKRLLVDRVTRSGQVPATHFVPDQTVSGYAELAAADRRAGTDPFAGPGHDFAPERARELLREAGYPIERRGPDWHAAGFPPLEILYNTGEGHRKIAVALQDMWKRALLERAAATADATQGMLLYRRAEERAVAGMCRLPLYFYTKSGLVKPYVKGFYPNALNKHPVRFLWLDPDWRRASGNRPAYEPGELGPPGRIAAP
ncbi:MAG: peptide ABC transporter substrate-binding protein [Deltaproteobacteria bacterium]|nr:peptide ABC transporter substrate-binding protein [Deltaproteobacteria bacterium]